MSRVDGGTKLYVQSQNHIQQIEGFVRAGGSGWVVLDDDYTSAAGLEAVAWPATVLNATAALGENRPLKRLTSEREFKETKRTSLFLSWLRLLLHVATRPTPALYALFEDDAPPQPSFADAVRRYRNDGARRAAFLCAPSEGRAAMLREDFPFLASS